MSIRALLIISIALLTLVIVPPILLPSEFKPDDGNYEYEWGEVSFDVDSIHYNRKNNMSEIQWIATVRPIQEYSKTCQFEPSDSLVTKDKKRFSGRSSHKKGCPENGSFCENPENDMYFAWIGDGVPYNAKLEIQISVSPECSLTDQKITSKHMLTGQVTRTNLWSYFWNGLLSV